MRRCATASGSTGAQDCRVQEEHRAGDGGHAADHDGEELAARHPGEIRPHEKRRLDHADEDVRGGGKPNHPAYTHQLLQGKRKDAHDRRQHAPIEEQRAQRAHHEHDRQRPEGEHESCSGIRDLERGRTASEVAEHQARPGLGRLLEHEQRVVQLEKGFLHQRDLQEYDGHDELQDEAGHDGPPRHRGALFAGEPGHCDETRYSGERVNRIGHLRT